MNFHFYLALNENEVRPMTTHFLPRVGDTVHVDGIDREINKVTWFSNGQRIEDAPLMNLKPAPAPVNQAVNYQAAGTKDTLAEQCIKTTFRGPAGSTTASKISAIKEYRARTNVGLREAKEAIDKAWLDLGMNSSTSWLA